MGIQPVYGKRGCFVTEVAIEKHLRINIFKLKRTIISITLGCSGSPISVQDCFLLSQITTTGTKKANVELE